MAIDSFSDAYTGRLFVVWENGSGGVAGSPTIELSWSSDNGTNWSNPISVASNFALENFEPSVAVAGDGSVYVVWYGENPSTGDYDLYGATSTDGGVMFGPQYVVSDVPSDPNFPDGNASYSAPWIGDYSGIVGDALGARPIWTDARSSLAHGPCDLCVQAPVAYNISLYSSLLVNATLSATIPVNVTVEGAVQGNGSAALSPRPTRLTWLAGAPYWIDAPAAVTWNSTTWVFRGWLGTNGGSSRESLPGPCAGPVRLAACYTLSSSAPCEGPGFLAVHVTPPTSEVTVNSAPVTPLEGWLNLTERPRNLLGQCGRSGICSPERGRLRHRGGVDPGHPPPPSRGTRRISRRVRHAGNGGSPHRRSARGGRPIGRLQPDRRRAGTTRSAPRRYRYLPQVDASVAVYSGLTTRVVLRLLPEFATLEGTVDPPSATVAIAGALTSLTPGGFFSTQRLAGTYWVNASAFERGGANRSVQLTPGNVTNLSIVLPFSVGWVEATVAPVTAEVTLGGRPLALGVDGQFNASMAPGSYWLNATAPGHRGLGQRVIVATGRTTIETVDLPAVAAAPWWRSQASFDAAAGPEPLSRARPSSDGSPSGGVVFPPDGPGRVLQ